MEIMPKWAEEEKDNLKRTVLEIATKQNIKRNFVLDSLTIDKALTNIILTLVHIQQEALPEKEQDPVLDALEKAEKMIKEKGKK